MADMWLAGEDVTTTRDTLISKYHPHLALIKDEIAIVFKEKGSAVGDKKIRGCTKKAGKMIQLLSGKEFVFVIEIGNDLWQEMSDDERVALLDHQLCYCKGEEKDDGSIKWYLDRPDVIYFRDEVTRNGWWSTSGQAPETAYIEKVFGKFDSGLVN